MGKTLGAGGTLQRVHRAELTPSQNQGQDRMIPKPTYRNRGVAMAHPVYWEQGGTVHEQNDYHINLPALEAQIAPLLQQDLAALILEGPYLDFADEEALLASELVVTGTGGRLGERHPLVRLYTRLKTEDEDGEITPILEDAVVGPDVLGYRDQTNSVAAMKGLYRDFKDLVSSTDEYGVENLLGQIAERVGETSAELDHDATLTAAIADR